MIRSLARLGLLFISLAAHAALASTDPHSFANTQAFRTRHLDLDLRADFAHKRLSGHVDLTLEQLDPNARELILDTRELAIDKVELLGDATRGLSFRLGEADPLLGAPLIVSLPASRPAGDIKVRVHYSTSPNASGLQWLEPVQTAGRKHPYLFSQSQAIHARSWIPLQDTPQVRATYSAHIQTPPELLAVMSAENEPNTPRDGDYRFHMPQRIPSYLIALGIGDLVFQPTGKRTGVYAEPPVVEAAAREFADTEAMLEACEKLFGPYRWGRYDLLILPPSFMWGGMENPRLTFLSPTVIAGDRSLVALIAHELAHSWSGNLVTNAAWDSAWLNEGFTTYLERRIVEALYGADRRAMEDVLGLQSLLRDMEELRANGDEQLTKLLVDLRGRDPDDGFSDVAYEKGRLFLGFLESRLGRDRLDAFLRSYFDEFAFQSVTTQTFVDYLREHVLALPGVKLTLAEVEQWIHEPGIPATAVLPHSDAFAKVDAQKQAWLAGERTAAQLDTASWTTHQWLHFLDNLPKDISTKRLRELDEAFAFTSSGNAEIAHSWLRLVVRAGYEPGYARLEEYLTTIGRRKLVKDLYDELLKTPEGTQRARAIYAKARSFYQVPLVRQLDAAMPN